MVSNIYNDWYWYSMMVTAYNYCNGIQIYDVPDDDLELPRRWFLGTTVGA